jgi:hypothetical protein
MVGGRSLTALTLLLLAGCAAPTPSSSAPSSGFVCLPESASDEKLIETEAGEYTAVVAYSASYADFRWHFPEGTNLTVELRATWDPGLAGEQVLRMRVQEEDARIGELLGDAEGRSPIVLNLTLTVPESGLRVFMEPTPNGGAPVAVNKQAIETTVQVVQTTVCQSE